MILEICASNYQSAINAQNAGAQRIELCSELAIGGITPNYGLIKQTVRALSIPVFVLIRPRSGNFTYSDSEFETMKHNIQLCRELGCSGIVSGVLNEDNTIDVKRTEELIALAKPLPFTFHRAFDWTPNPSEAIKQLITIGADRVLTSGQASSAELGLSLLSNLKTQVEGKIVILPGGGINSGNIKQFKAKGFVEAHASATRISQVNKQPEVAMNSAQFFDERVSVVSDITKIKDILNTIKD